MQANRRRKRVGKDNHHQRKGGKVGGANRRHTGRRNRTVLLCSSLFLLFFWFSCVFFLCAFLVFSLFVLSFVSHSFHPFFRPTPDPPNAKPPTPEPSPPTWRGDGATAREERDGPLPQERGWRQTTTGEGGRVGEIYSIVIPVFQKKRDRPRHPQKAEHGSISRKRQRGAASRKRREEKQHHQKKEKAKQHDPTAKRMESGFVPRRRRKASRLFNCCVPREAHTCHLGQGVRTVVCLPPLPCLRLRPYPRPRSCRCLRPSVSVSVCEVASVSLSVPACVAADSVASRVRARVTIQMIRHGRRRQHPTQTPEVSSLDVRPHRLVPLYVNLEGLHAFSCRQCANNFKKKIEC